MMTDRESKTYWTVRRLRDARRDLLDMAMDARRDQRLAVGECHVCFYWAGGRVSGQAFRDYTCAICGSEQSHPNTAVPKLCEACGTEQHLCRRCMADLAEVEKAVASNEPDKRPPKPRAIKKARKKSKSPQTVCDDFNLAHGVGTRVRFWTGAREGEGRVSRTRSEAQVLSGHTAVVWIAGVAGCVALSHVEPLGDGQ